MVAPFTAKRESQIRRKAESLVHKVAADGLHIRSVADLIPAVEADLGLSITVVEKRLPCDVFGFVESSEPNRFQVTMSCLCTTRQHTLAHELGHIVLGHQGCSLEDIEVPDESYRDLARFLAGAEMEDQGKEFEWEAEAFANRLMEMLVEPSSPSGSRDLMWRAALYL